jgi:drug/metabolite transporter superfamily protein YnfA
MPVPPITPHALVIAGFAVLFVFVMYRRFRRLFGRQPVQPARLKFRVAILLLAGGFLLLRGGLDAQGGLAVGLGLAGGVALGLLGVRLTRFEDTPQGRFYTPHGGIGLVLSALLLGRLAYRFVTIWPLMQGARMAGENPMGSFERSPLTLAIFALLVGYYVTYYVGILLRSGAHAVKTAP